MVTTIEFAAPVPSLNPMLMMAIADLNRSGADGSLTLKARADGAWRVLHISKSALIASESSVVSERLGNMLATEGRLDPVLIEPVANEARKRKTLLGNQLVTDGLLSPTDLASALERQGRLRLENALATPGTVSIAPKGSVERMTRTPLGAAVMIAFRGRINLRAIQELVAERPRQPLALDLHNEIFNHLELGPSELRICRAVASGQTLDQVLAASTAPEAVTRIMGVLVALGLWA